MYLIRRIELALFLILWCSILGLIPASAYEHVNSVIVNDTVYIDTPNDFDGPEARQWRSIGRTLTNTHHKVYVLRWAGLGGYVDTGKEFIRSIQAARAQGKIIIIEIKGNSYSVHAIVPCYASKVYNKTGSFLMYHADGYTKKHIDVRANQRDSQVNQQMDMCVSRGFITKAQVNKMWQGYEVYISPTNTWYKVDTRPLR